MRLEERKPEMGKTPTEANEGNEGDRGTSPKCGLRIADWGASTALNPALRAEGLFF
jgi:hypothetical protein